MTSPTSRSVSALRSEGWTVETVEQWIPKTRIRRDLFGFADLLAIRTGDDPTLIQVTSVDNLAARRRKIIAEPRALTALHVGFRILVHGWRDPSPKFPLGGLREEAVTLTDILEPAE